MFSKCVSFSLRPTPSPRVVPRGWLGIGNRVVSDVVDVVRRRQPISFY